MKVLIFRTNGNIVDLNTYNLQEIGIAKALILRGIECDVMYYGGNVATHEEMIDFKGQSVRVIWARGFSIAGNGFFLGVKDILDNYDIIQVCEYDQLFSRYIAFFSRYKNRVCLSHGPYYNITNKKYNLKIKVMDSLWIPQKQKEKIWCFAKSDYAKDFLIKRGFKNISVTGVGLDIDRFNDDIIAKQGTIIEELKQFKNGEFLLLYLGQISDRRSTLFLLELMKKLLSFDSGIKLAIIGDGKDEYKSQFFERLNRLEFGNNVFYKDKIDHKQIPYLYELADLFLLPSKYEIFGMVMLESMYFGVPCMTTDNGGSVTVIKNGYNGFVLPLEYDDWIQKILEIKDNPDISKKVSDAAHATIVENFTWDKITESMIQVYHLM